MSRQLNSQENTSVTQAVEFLRHLIECYKSLPANDQLSDQLSEIESIVDELSSMLREGKIDVDTTRYSVKASTDGDGIHLNDASLILPGDLLLDDCGEGYFGALWELIAVLIHELNHYREDTGLWGRVIKRVPNTFFGGLALIVDSALGGTHRSWAWHENRAYRFAYSKLGFLEHMIFMICLANMDCAKCCEKHKDRLHEVRRRQDPNTSFGN